MSLEHLSELDPILDNLGRRHGKLEVNGKFRTYYWSTFLECSICIFRKTLTSCRKYPDKEIDNTIILWRYLLRDVMKKIKVSAQAPPLCYTDRSCQLQYHWAAVQPNLGFPVVISLVAVLSSSSAITSIRLP
ncbi:hypothetical protein TELCIR_11538 [Teladorsagia circumcincta]|uniref:Globin family profile domain-containing protein n=1 Tax=Teladorsagia circumcincta TaxID=45464 RepID=A0A2G9U8Y9_TELCI|nr:hypothetical protein TELCIR_11538 [Teladorsagia circumcincta]